MSKVLLRFLIDFNYYCIRLVVMRNKNVFYLLSKKSFSLTELEMYIIAVGILSGIIMGTTTVLTKVHVNRVISELKFYETALTSFVSEYGTYPIMTQKKCQRAGFKNCNQSNTFSKDVALSTQTSGLDLCNDGDKCKIQLYNYGRFLSASGLISKRVGITLTDNFPDELKNTTALNWLSSINNDPKQYLPYVNIDNKEGYMFYFVNTIGYTGQIGIAEYATNGKAPAHLFNYSFKYPYTPNNSHNWWLTQKNTDKPVLVFATIYPRRKQAFLAPNIMQDVDKKIDDGLPRTGRVIGIGYNKAHCDTSDIYNASNDIATDKLIYYLSSRDYSIGCQLAYQMNSLKDMLW